MADAGSMKNADVLNMAEVSLVGALSAGTGVTLQGVRLFHGPVVAETEFRSGEFEDRGSLYTAEIRKTDEGALIPVLHTAEELREWADGVFNRLMDERKSFNQPEKGRAPIGGDDPTELSGAVVAQNLTRKYTVKSNSYWVGLMGADIGARNAQARGTRQAAMIAKQGGWRVGGTFVEDIGNGAVEGVFHSRKAALKAAARVAFGKDWWKHDKAGRLDSLKEYIVNARDGSNGYNKPAAPAPAEVVPEAATEAAQAEAPAAQATTKTINELRAIAKSLNLSAGGSKEDIANRIRDFYAGLGL
tara:strand:+ start:105 stop:1010 length:906 start_codon:yes stop_codon:yes gene_type:complete